MFPRKSGDMNGGSESEFLHIFTPRSTTIYILSNLRKVYISFKKNTHLYATLHSALQEKPMWNELVHTKWHI